MLAQSTDAQSLLKSVIAGYNSKLADRAAQLMANNTDVSNFLQIAYILTFKNHMDYR